MPETRPAIEVVSVDDTSKTLAALVSDGILRDSTTRIVLRPHGGGIFMDVGTASAASDPIGLAPFEIEGTRGDLAELEFFAATATGMTVMQEGYLRFGAPLALPYQYDIAQGNIANHTSVNKFGHNGAVGAAAEPIWDFSAAYDYLADDTFSLMYISSDAAADQGMAFDVTGIDSDYNYSTVTVTTDGADGTTFVALTSGATDNKWWRIFRAENMSGTNQTGNIYISKDNTDVGGDGIPDSTDDIQAQVLIASQQTLMALWSCPVGNTAYITGYYASTSSNLVTTVDLQVRSFGGIFNTKHRIVIDQAYIQHSFEFPVSVAAKSDVRVVAMAGGGGGVVSAGFDLWFET